MNFGSFRKNIKPGINLKAIDILLMVASTTLWAFIFALIFGQLGV